MTLRDELAGLDMLNIEVIVKDFLLRNRVQEDTDQAAADAELAVFDGRYPVLKHIVVDVVDVLSEGSEPESDFTLGVFMGALAFAQALGEVADLNGRPTLSA